MRILSVVALCLTTYCGVPTLASFCGVANSVIEQSFQETAATLTEATTQAAYR